MKTGSVRTATTKVAFTDRDTGLKHPIMKGRYHMRWIRPNRASTSSETTRTSKYKYIGVAVATAIAVTAATSTPAAHAAYPATRYNKNPTYNFTIPAYYEALITAAGNVDGTVSFFGNVSMTDGSKTATVLGRNQTTALCSISGQYTVEYSASLGENNTVMQQAANFYDQVLKNASQTLGNNWNISSVMTSTDYGLLTRTYYEVHGYFTQVEPAHCADVKQAVFPTKASQPKYTADGIPANPQPLWEAPTFSFVTFIGYAVISMAIGSAIVTVSPTMFTYTATQLAAAGAGSALAFFLANGIALHDWTASWTGVLTTFVFAGTVNPAWSHYWQRLKNKATAAAAAALAADGNQAEGAGRLLTQGGTTSIPRSTNPFLDLIAFPRGGLSLLSSSLNAAMLGGAQNNASLNQISVSAIEQTLPDVMESALKCSDVHLLGC
jgi:hypothetical protein